MHIPVCDGVTSFHPDHKTSGAYPVHIIKEIPSYLSLKEFVMASCDKQLSPEQKVELMSKINTPTGAIESVGIKKHIALS
jgi:hypothetical protein